MTDKTPDADRVMAGWQETIREVEANKDGFVEIPRKRIASQPTQVMNDKTLIEPSNDEQSQWSEATEVYVRGLEEQNEAQATRIEALEAALRDVFIHGHSEGWRGNQMRRDVQHVDAEKSWSLYVSNGALSKTIARQALAGDTNHG